MRFNFSKMKQAETIAIARAEIKRLRQNGKRIAFVPTMGALHNGHISLIREARKHAEHVVISIFVNPEQFGPNEDFEHYPRPLEKDLEICAKEGVALAFTPSEEEMYGYGPKQLSIQIASLNKYMDGGSRPGFFEGIVLVVNKLFNIIEPDVAVFGQKDIQQFIILSRMVREFNHNVEMMMAPIQRADDGLALSSRNAYLSHEEREIAPELYKALKYVEMRILSGTKNPSPLLTQVQKELETKGFKNDYLNVFSYETLTPVEIIESGFTYILAGAVYLGKTRLIDNLIIEA